MWEYRLLPTVEGTCVSPQKTVSSCTLSSFTEFSSEGVNLFILAHAQNEAPQSKMEQGVRASVSSEYQLSELETDGELDIGSLKQWLYVHCYGRAGEGL